MFNRYIGLGGAFGYWRVWYEDGWAAEKDWEIESDDNKPSNFYLHPSIVLKSPALKIKQVDLGLYAEPGIILNIPYQRINIRQYTNWPDYNYKFVSMNRITAFHTNLPIYEFRFQQKVYQTNCNDAFFVAFRLNVVFDNYYFLE